MNLRKRTSLRDGLSLALLAACIIGLITVVSIGRPSPRMAASVAPTVIARGPTVPAATYIIHQAETHSAPLLQAAFDRIGFDLDSVAAGYISVPRVLLSALPPDIERLDSMDARKVLFLRTLLPVVLAVNDEIGADRARLLDVRAQIASGTPLADADVQWVMGLADVYDQPDADIGALLKKIDVIPPSLTLAQAIQESGWGTSRIAREQNALFGQFGQDASGGWDYRDFESLSEAVQSYAHNLNTHRAYREFRAARAKMRQKGADIDAWELASTMHRYSERGDEYVQAVRSIMRDNSLESFDAARLKGRGVPTIVASNE
ncbi:MAG TPA: glucosaminidase domain-containing protein [Patescibacteria group bacterium]|nr:glucosaminidase domain-containing protein [Patescibacteria group bacterium]